MSLPVLVLIVAGHNDVPDYSDSVPESECFNRTRVFALKSTEQFLQTGNMTIGELAVDSTNNYVNCLNKMAPENALRHQSSLQYELRNRELSLTKCNLRTIKEIYGLAEMDADIRDYNKKEEILTDETERKKEFKLLKDLTSLLKESVRKHVSALLKVTCVHSIMKSCNTSSFNSSWICALLSEKEWESRIKNKTDTLKGYNDECEAVETERFFGKYVNPVIYSVILLVGLVGNGSILLIFALNRNVRTKSNVMIFNLVVGDTLNLLINIPVHYMVHFSSVLGPLTGVYCHLFAMMRFVFFAVSALSVVFLSLQRYFITVHLFWRPVISRKCSVLLYVVTVWLLAIFVSLPEAFNVRDRNGICSSYSQARRKLVSMLTFLLYCVVCPCAMAVFSAVTARRLRNSVRDVTSQSCNRAVELSRTRTASVLRALNVVFLISYVPAYTWYMVAYWFTDELNELPAIVPICIDNVSYHLLFLNVCFNPVALYTVSGTFRKPLCVCMLRFCSK